jgi:hypothetical protein
VRTEHPVLHILFCATFAITLNNGQLVQIETSLLSSASGGVFARWPGSRFGEQLSPVVLAVWR